MKYIRTKNGIYEFRKLVDFEIYLCAQRYEEKCYELLKKEYQLTKAPQSFMYVEEV